MNPAPMYYYRQSLNRRKKIIKQAVLLGLLVFFLFAGFKLITEVPVMRNIQKLPVYILGEENQYAHNLMSNAMPVLEQTGVIEQDKSKQVTRLMIEELSQIVMVGPFIMDRHNHTALLKKELPVSAEPPSTEPGTVPVTDMNTNMPSPQALSPDSEEEESDSESEEPGSFSDPPAELSENNLVVIYNTHTGETYALTDGMDRLQGKRGGVVKVAAALEEELEKNHGIRVARSEEINDKVYRYSYSHSKENLEELLEENPHTLAVFDIHRDAGIARDESIVTVNGEKAAPVTIVVGSDARAPFPDWEKNHSFAKELKSRINDEYPGLCEKVSVQNGRYNQHLHQRALLLEIGSVSNYTREAEYTARLIGQVLGPVIRELYEETNEN